MTPGLAGFVASDDALGADTVGTPESAADTRNSSVSAALEALGESFTLVPEHGTTASRANPGTQVSRTPRRRTWLDTFDWRLYRAGLLLEYVPVHRGGELRLAERPNQDQDQRPNQDQDQRPNQGQDQGKGRSRQPDRSASAGSASDPAGLLAVQHVAGWHSARPHLAGDLPAGPVTDRVARVIGPRALLALVTVTTSVTVTRLLNEDAKTVARLLVERPSRAAVNLRTASTTANGHSLAPRLTIAEVRGYPGPARRAARIIGETPGFTPAEGDLLTDALAASGRRPGDYSNKVNADIAPGMPAGQAVAVILLRLLDMAELNAPGVLNDIDPEFLHDFRVAVRRTRAALKLFGGALGRPADVTRFAAEFKWLGDITTPTRDLDVHLLGFEDMARSLRAAKPDDLEPFRDYLHGRRTREYRALARALRTPRYRELTRDWRDTLTPLSEGGRPKGPRTSAATLAAESTRKAFVKVARMGGAITPDSPAESLHDLRKRCKELRYALELFAPLYAPDTYGRVVGDLKRLQDCLGTFQDNEVQIAEIQSLATAMLTANQAPAVTLLAMGEVAGGLADGQATARADFGRRFADFTGVEGRRRMSALLRGTSYRTASGAARETE